MHLSLCNQKFPSCSRSAVVRLAAVPIEAVIFPEVKLTLISKEADQPRDPIANLS